MSDKIKKPNQYELQEAALCIARLLDEYHLNELLNELHDLEQKDER